MAKVLNNSIISEEKIHTLLNQAPFSTALLTGDDFVVELANDISLKLWGKDSSIIGLPLLDGVPELENQEVFNRLKEVYHTGIPFEGKENIAFLEVNGVMKKIYVNVLYKPIHNKEGEVISVMAVGYDVTEHVESRRKIAESEERARLAVDAAGLGTFDLNYISGDIITSPRFDEIFGFNGPQPHYKYISVIHPNDRALRNTAHNKATATGTLDYEARLKWPDGSIHWVRFKGKVYYDNNHTPTRLLGTVLDTTEQNLTMQRLEESEQRFRTLITETPEVASGLYIGRDIRIQYVNSVMLRFWDKDESVIGKKFREAIPELKGQPFFDQLDHVFATGEAFTGKEVKAYLMKNGRLQPFYFNYTYKALRNAKGEIYGIHHMAVDVTDQVLNKQKLEESEKRFRNLLLQAPFGICILKGNEFITDFANDIFLQIVDRKREEYIGKSLWIGLPELEGQIYKKLLNEVMRTGVPFHGQEYELQIKRHDKLETVYVDFSYEPIKNDEGKIDGILAVAVDVTLKVIARKEIEKARDNFNAILETLPQIAWTADTLGILNYITEQWFEYTGLLDRGELMKTWMHAFMPDEVDEILREWTRCIREGNFFEQERRIKRADGQFRWHLIRAVPVKNEQHEITLWVGTATDIHDQKLFREELERKIKERTKELERSNSELEQFAYVSSHDLQEPLRKITVFTNMLKTSLGEIPEKSQTYLEKISASSARMASLIKGILEFSRLTKKEKLYTAISLNQVLKDVLNDFDLLIEQKNATIKIDDLGTVEALPLQMAQLFSNLLSNSLKFADVNRAPEIVVSMKPLTAEEVSLHKDLNSSLPYIQIEWKDNGIGLSQEYAEQIFVIFQRLNDRQSYSGTGIGLAMCKRIVMNHHGEIYVKSALDEGSTFYILLPAKQPVLT